MSARHLTRRRWGVAIWMGIAGLGAAGVLFMTYRSLDLERLSDVLKNADWFWIGVLLLSIPSEQLVRGWKWRQILYDLRPIGTIRLFGATVAGYFVGMIIPLGVSPLVRAWLVARMEGLRISTILLTTAIERFIDGIVFSCIVAVLILFSSLPGVGSEIWQGLIVAGFGGFLLFSGLMVGVFKARDRMARRETLIGRAVARLEGAFGGRLSGIGNAIAEGILWPRSRWRGGSIIAASVVMKVISTLNFVWAGLAIGVVLSPFDYLFLLVFGAFSLIISSFARIPGGYIIGLAFALKLLGVADEEALPMVMFVYAATILTTVGIGIMGLWYGGVTYSDVRRKIDSRE